ncbi:cupin domain-containing protein [uncultured Marinobacter sp.]|uniref:cupin domain-containing protein n=1 Tax=uncultured Marinobacter sp. TaxID=187379 RepID=UPI0030D8F83E
MATITELPGGLAADVFLRDYWQKKPLVIRQAFVDFECAVSADELAGLACEESVESRLIVEQENGAPWQLHNGPFTPEQLTSPPAGNWTLLVQGLDHWVPEIADILDHFRFVPNWRLDDIMASYAPPGGSVGPHYDQYDVFLLQAQGHRRWQFGGRCDAGSPRLEGTPLRILSDWQAEETVVLAPGDMLYVPPGIGHHGIAEDECITLSVGFRAPTTDDLLTGFTDFLCSETPVDGHLPDLNPELPDNPGEIQPQVLEQLRSLIVDQIDNPRQLALWFGQFSTAPKNADIVMPAEQPMQADELKSWLASGAILRWNEGSRFAYTGLEQQTALFVDGDRYLLSGDARPLAQVLCAASRPDQQALLALCADDTLAELLTVLHNQGSVYFE